jgi:hypothetical protein
MITSLASNCDLKSPTGGELCLFVVQVPSFVQVASIVVVGSVLGNAVVGVANVAGTSFALQVEHLAGLRVVELAFGYATH